jgi:hypothetical protein
MFQQGNICFIYITNRYWPLDSAILGEPAVSNHGLFWPVPGLTFRRGCRGGAQETAFQQRGSEGGRWIPAHAGYLW